MIGLLRLLSYEYDFDCCCRRVLWSVILRSEDSSRLAVAVRIFTTLQWCRYCGCFSGSCDGDLGGIVEEDQTRMIKMNNL